MTVVMDPYPGAAGSLLEASEAILRSEYRSCSAGAVKIFKLLLRVTLMDYQYKMVTCYKLVLGITE
jgi:hypothetical protein